jgi:hypothetical protein
MLWIDAPEGTHGHGLTAREFREQFLEICERHRQENRALAFAFLLYRLEDAPVIKTLQDEVYWNALDEMAGRFITVYVFYSPVKRPKADDDPWRQKSREEASASAALELLQQHFSVDRNLELPCMLFFQVKKKEVVDSYVVPLSHSNIEATFSELRDILDASRRAVEKVMPENKNNAQEIFNLIRGEFDNLSLKGKIVKGGTAIITVSRLVGTLVKLVGG